MPLTIRFAYAGDQQFLRTLDRFEDRAQDLTELWEHLAAWFEQLEAEQFASEGRRGSGGWAPLSERYAEWKAEHYPGETILMREHDLYESLTDSTSPGAIRVILPHRMVLGSAVEYGAYHQQGGDRLPQRRPIELTEADRTYMGKAAHYYIVTGKLL